MEPATGKLTAHENLDVLLKNEENRNIVRKTYNTGQYRHENHRKQWNFNYLYLYEEDRCFRAYATVLRAGSGDDHTAAWHIAPETDAGERWRVLRLFYYWK